MLAGVGTTVSSPMSWLPGTHTIGTVRPAVMRWTSANCTGSSGSSTMSPPITTKSGPIALAMATARS